jgi:hypothetical protein
MNKIEMAFDRVEKQDRPFVGAKVFEYMESHTSHAQGDVEVVRLDSLPEGLKLIEKFSGILAEGLADSGNHVIQSLEGVKAFYHPNPTEYDGPLLEVEKSWTLTHPNHKWVTFPAGCYQVRFPREMHLGEMRKQRD